MKRPFVTRKYRSSDIEQCRSLWKELTEWHRIIYKDPTIGGENPRTTLTIIWQKLVATGFGLPFMETL